MRTPEGSTYGPVTWDEVGSWAAEGRIEAKCELSQSPTGPWRAASAYLPNLRPSPVAPPLPERTAQAAWSPAYQPAAVGAASHAAAKPAYDPAAYSPATAGSYYVPHRGGLILVLGLLGFLISCPIFSLLAWVMGSHDLREIRAGRMDPSGEGLTQAGQIMGMVLSLLWIAGTVLCLGLIALFALMN